MSCTHTAAVSRQPTPARDGDENTEPGSDGTTTSNASAGSPPKRSGCASGSIIAAKSQNVHGHPWVSTSGSGAGPEPRSWSACTVTPSISTAHVRPPVHRRLVLAPVVPVAPVRDELAEVRAGHAVAPVVDPGGLVGPDRRCAGVRRAAARRSSVMWIRYGSTVTTNSLTLLDLTPLTAGVDS